MAGSQPAYPPNVVVEAALVWNMPYLVQREDSQPSDIMRYMISLPHCSQKSAMKCVLNLNYSQSHPINSTGLLLIDRMVQGWMCRSLGWKISKNLLQCESI